MVYIVRNRYAHYKKYQLDIWGLVRTLVKLYPQPYGFFLRRPKKSKDSYRQQPWTKAYNYEEKDKFLLEDSWKSPFDDVEEKKELYSKRRFPLILTQGTKKKTKMVVFFYKLWEQRRLRRTQASRRYIYRIDIKPLPYRRRRLKSPYLRVHLLRLYYMIYNYRQLKKIFRNAHKRLGFYDNNLALLLECRSMCFLYRTGFLPSMFAAISYIKSLCVLVDGKLIYSVHKRILPGELLSFTQQAKLLLASSLLKRAKKKRMLFAHAPFLFVSYSLFVAYYKTLPSMRQLVFPIRFDLHSVINYFASRK